VPKSYYVYILMNDKNTTSYIGVTNDLERRVYEHQHQLVPGFTKKYNVHKLVYVEETDNAYSAIAREKQLKNWHRKWKLNLIKKENPKLTDLSVTWEWDAETSSA
jgi:putative endonuclease